MQQLIRRRQREAAEERESRREGTNSILSTRVPAAIYVVTSLLVFLCGILLTVTILSLGTDPDLDLSCLLYTSPSPRDRTRSRMPSSA